ncbi:hypothetical protein U176_02779, partial [Staphylococcus aureus F54471]
FALHDMTCNAKSVILVLKVEVVEWIGLKTLLKN